MAILFYKCYDNGVELPYGCFSNFSKHDIVENGVRYQTSEHYFQSKKFLDEKNQLDVINAQGPGACAKVGRDRSRPLREDWDQVKDQVMYDAIKLKFDQHPEIKKILLSTDSEDLVEDSPIDWYWGWGADRKGKNMLGQLLVKLRESYK